MSLPTARFALPHVGTTGNQGSNLAARADPQVRRLLWCRQPAQRSVRSHDVHDFQCRHVPELSQAPAAPTDTRAAHDAGTGQRSVSSRDPLGPIFAQPRSKPTAVVSAAIQPATSPDRTRLEADPTPRNAQPVLRDASRSAQSCQCLLRWLAPTKQSAASTMLHYLRRCVYQNTHSWRSPDFPQRL
jgi:hypothetical protein